MVDFEFLSEPAEPYSYVAKSRFADGTSVIANMTGKDYRHNKIKIKAHSFLITKEEK